MTTSQPVAPWARLPQQLAVTLAPEVGRLQADILRLIDGGPEWAGRVGDEKMRADLRRATRTVLARFVRLIGTHEPPLTAPERVQFRELGAGEAREGRGLEDLLAAYRIGTRVLYTEVARALAGLDPSPEAQLALGEAVFSLSDALQSESTEGYAHELTTHTGERERRLRRLAEALFTGEQDTVRAVAHQVGWTVPAEIAVAILPTERITQARAALAGQGFVVERDDVAVAVLDATPTLPHTLQVLAQALDGAGASLRIGPPVPPADARRSLVCALLLPDAGGGGATLAVDHLPVLLTRGAPEVAETLRWLALEPLGSVRPAQRDRLTATLASWLRHWGQRQLVAAELSIHPQTVAYRVNQLRDLFGDALDDPQSRLELQLALLSDEARGSE